MYSQKHIAIRPGKPLLLASMAALCTGLPALTHAQSPLHPTNELIQQSSQLLTQTTASSLSMFDSVIMIYLVPLTMILSVLGWMLLRRRPQTPAISSSAPTLLEIQIPPQLIAQPPRPLTTKTRKSPPPLPSNHTTQPESSDTSTESNTTTQAKFAIHPPEPRRQCSHCKQFFDAHLNYCPNNACALPPVQTASATTIINPKNALQRTQCTQCGRRFEEGTRYCYVDGMPLINDTTEEAAHAEPIKVCRICGQEAAQKHERCPHDNTELTLINPGNLTRITPAIPLLICSKCRQYAMPGTAFCPNDGELLTPLVNAKFAALPASGFGPRRKLCRKCGTRYSDACTFCSQDGTPLTPIN